MQNSSDPTTMHVRYYQDPRTQSWTARVDEIPEIVTQGHNLAKTYERVREALSLVRPDALTLRLEGETFWEDRADLQSLPAALRGLIKHEADLRLKQLELEDELRQTTLEGVRQLVGGYQCSYRDAGQLLGITFQRVEQICNQLGIRSSGGQSERLVRG